MILRPPGRGIHWQAPSVIILAFTAGLAFAVGHHVFYTSLDRKPLDDDIFGQQTNIAIGTGFAFLVRACLVVATCAAYWQVFWETALRKTLTISSVDALTGVLGSLVEFSSIRTLLFNPVLALMALLAWTVPLASLLPPATLSVIPDSTMNSTYANVPVPNFADVLMAGSTYRNLAGDRFVTSKVIDRYLKPSMRLSRLATTTAYRGAIPEHETLFPNSTYELDFHAPAVQCEPISQAVMAPFNTAANCNFTASRALWNVSSDSWGEIENACAGANPFVSWVPDYEYVVPFVNGSVRNGLLPLDEEMESMDPGTDYNKRFLGNWKDSPPFLFVASRNQEPPLDQGKWDVLNCSLYNATYDVRMSSDSNSHSLPQLSNVQILDSVPFQEETPSRDMGTLAAPIESTIFSYMALMESLNRLLVGSIASSATRAEANIYWSQATLRFQNPHLMNTLMAFTKELQPLLSRSRHPQNDAEPDESQWTIVAESNDSLISLPNEALNAPTTNMSLSTVIEELFQNMTLSLFSDAYFLKETDEPVNVTRSYTRNIYTYSQRNLLMSYGIALGLTLLASIAGCVAIIFNGASYTHKFSTILRTTSGFEELVNEKDRSGADPLPKYLSRANLQLGRSVEGTQQAQQAPEVTSERSHMMELGRDATKSPAMVNERSISQER